MNRAMCDCHRGFKVYLCIQSYHITQVAESPKLSQLNVLQF